jgi:hypothetical protein
MTGDDTIGGGFALASESVERFKGKELRSQELQELQNGIGLSTIDSTPIRSFSVPMLKIQDCVAVTHSVTPATPDS